MSNLEVVLNMLAETTTTEIAKKEKPHGLSANIRVAREGASFAGDARKKIESKTGEPVLIGRNAKKLKKIIKYVKHIKYLAFVKRLYYDAGV